MIDNCLARAAETLVGAPFRLHGRDPATGLDCLGVLAASLALCRKPALLPSGYALRTRSLPKLDNYVSACGLEPVMRSPAAGDVLLFQAGPVQFHLTVASSQSSIIHAHAGLRRVVHSALPAHWPVIGHWQLGTAD